MSPRPLALLNGLVLLVALVVVTTGAEPAASLTGTGEPPATVTAPSAPVTPVTPIEPAPAVAAPVDPPAPAAPSPPAAPPPAPRATTTTGYAPYATVGPVVLHAPGDVVEAIGFHQSGHDGALPQSPVPGPVRAGLLDQRGRDTDRAGAADIVVDPDREVRSPVTGTVVRAGSYTLYCDHTDDYVVVEPDARPGWEVKVLHFHGLKVSRGDRVEAGVTVIGDGSRVLPFRSQVDDHTASPAWPHLHVEVVDPSIPDRPSGGGC